MKSILTFLLPVFAVVMFFTVSTTSAHAQARGEGVRVSPNAAVSQNIGATVVDITYGRPGLKGRSLESLAPAGQVWRTGANESAVISFSTDVMFGGEMVEAGTYSLYTIPGENWTFILNSKQSWGTQYDESADVLRVAAAVTTTEATEMEWFGIYFDTLSETKAHLNLHWGTTLTAIPITVE
jgi:hypothetical protein